MTMQQVSGEDAKRYNVVRLDSMATVNRGPLVSADTQTGKVSWMDKTDTVQVTTLLPQNLRIVPK